MRSKIVFVVFMLWASISSAAQTVFEFVSQTGDYIGSGQTVVITPVDADFNPSVNFGNGVSFYINNFSRVPSPNPYIFWSADFAAPGGLPLQVGSYPIATRYPFQAPSDAGLNISGDGRGCNNSYGSFTVLEVVVDPATGTVQRFAADFEQRCESPNAPQLAGAIRFNSDVPVTNIIAASISFSRSINFQGCFEATSPDGAQVIATASAIGATNPDFTWSTSTGRTGTGVNFPLQVSLGFSSVTLTTTDLSTGKTVTVSRNICSSDTTPPTVSILSPIQGASYSRLPVLDVKVTDAVDKDIKQIRVNIGETAAFPLNGNGRVRTQIVPRKSVGNMIETQITVTATDASNNTASSSVTIWLEKSLR